MILVNHYAIRPPIPKIVFIKHCWFEIIAVSFVFFHRERSFFQCLLPFSTTIAVCICSNSSSCHNVFIMWLLSLSGVTTLSLLAGVCAACMLTYRSLQMKWWAAVMVCAIPLQKALLMCLYVSSGKFEVLAPRCSRALLHYLELTPDHRLLFASQLARRLPEWSLQLPSFLAFYVSKGRAGRSNTSIRTLCFHFAVTWCLLSTCHVQGDWYCPALP